MLHEGSEPHDFYEEQIGVLILLHLKTSCPSRLQKLSTEVLLLPNTCVFVSADRLCRLWTNSQHMKLAKCPTDRQEMSDNRVACDAHQRNFDSCTSSAKLHCSQIPLRTTVANRSRPSLSVLFQQPRPFFVGGHECKRNVRRSPELGFKIYFLIYICCKNYFVRQMRSGRIPPRQ